VNDTRARGLGVNVGMNIDIDIDFDFDIDINTVIDAPVQKSVKAMGEVPARPLRRSR
jgi:hypothetical protein